ncbi:MAG: flagellin [Candidatus Calescibacterium sp.]
MAIPVLTNQHGLIGAEDLRRVTIELGGVMKRLQTGFRVNSAGEDTGALVQSNILSRALDTLQIASEQVAKAESILTKMEDTVKRIYDILSQMKLNAQRAVVSTDSEEISALQASSEELYVEIRELVRSTVFQKSQLLRGGLGNRMIAPITIGSTGPVLTLYRVSFDVSGINLAGYASGSLADVAAPNLVTVQGNSVAGTSLGAMFTSSVVPGGRATLSFSVGGGIATAALYIGGSVVFTESIRINFTGAQVLDFKNLGFRVFVEELQRTSDPNQQFGPNTTISAVTITIQREGARVFRGTHVGSELDYIHFDIPNLEPENLLGSVSLGGGMLFTFDLRSAPETAVSLIEEAIEYVEKVRSKIGSIRSLLRTAQEQVQEQRIIAQVQRSAVIDTKFDEESLRLTALQVVQQSATAMIAISRLTPQLVLQLIGGR